MKTQREALERTNWKTNLVEQGEKAHDIQEIAWLEIELSQKLASCIFFPPGQLVPIFLRGFLGYSAHVAPSGSGFEGLILRRGCLGRSGLVPRQARRRMEGAKWVQTWHEAFRAQPQPASASPRGFCSGPQTPGHLPEKRGSWRFLEKQLPTKSPQSIGSGGLFAAAWACL